MDHHANWQTPIQTRATMKRVKHTHETIFDKLPAELLVEVLLASDARDVEALGSTCAAMRLVARDSGLWRRLFERDYGQSYGYGIYTEPWPHGDRTADPWPEFALSPRDSLDEVRARLPPAPIGTWSPRPFARMEAMGKGARWLYIAHAHHVGRRDARVGIDPMPATFVCCVNCEEDATVLYRGDVALGTDGMVLPFGYGVVFNMNTNGETVEWAEGTRCGGNSLGWQVHVANRKATLIGSACPYGTRYHYQVERLGGERVWRRAFKGKRRHGPSFKLYADGALCTDVYSYDEHVAVEFKAPGGQIIVRGTDESGHIARVGEIRYPNGDRASYTRSDPCSPLSIVRFWISERCPDPSFAGRDIADAQWASESAQINPCHVMSAFWTTGHGESDRLFRDYVRKGLAGWPPVLQAVTMERIQQFSD